uniref:Pyroglutamyl-peptidase I n=1 Tax=Homalodisca liturata TaxID=320908 RepID=A0A1B6HXA1_9HEMI
MAALSETQPDEELNNLVCEARNTVIVTGFGPFQNHNINASWEAVRLLPSTGIESDLNICLVTEQIPVSYNDVGTKIPKLWNSYKPLLVVHVGVSHLARKITLEQAAQKSGYDRQDIYGQTPACNECCVGSTPLIRSGLDINQLSNTINSTSETVQTCLSDDAGRYLCEYIYYTSLSIDKTRSIFVHVPPLDQPYSAQQLAEGLAAIVRCLVQQLRDPQLDKVAIS